MGGDPMDGELIPELERQAAEQPGRTVYRNGGQALHWKELWEGASRLANVLTEWLPERGVPVGVYGHKEAWMPVCFLACALAGHPYLPLDTSFPPERIRRILMDAGAPLLLAAAPCPVGDAGVAALEWKGAVHTAVELEQAIRSAKPLPKGQWVTGDERFYLIYTSGSTGKPKGVQISGRNLYGFSRWAAAFGSPGDVWLNQAPYSFDLSVLSLYPALLSGGTVYDLNWHASREGGADLGCVPDFPGLYRCLAQSGITIWVSTPSFAELCLADPTFSEAILPGLRKFLFCGETLTPRTAERLMERFPKAELWNLYGPTETTVAVTAAEITREILKDAPERLPVGQARTGCGVWILDENQKPLPEGETGRIVITGEAVGSYVNPTMNGSGDMGAGASFGRIAPAGIPLPAYCTGDIGYLEKGQLYFCGRADGQLKLHGYRIEPGEIEAALLEIPGVRQAAVLPVGIRNQETQLAAFVVGGPAAEDIRESLGRVLPGYMLPKRVIPLPALPLTSGGKRDDAALKGMVSMEQELLGLLAQSCGDDTPLSQLEVDLYETGLLDSMGLVVFFEAVEDRFRAELYPTEFSHEELRTPAALVKAVSKKLRPGGEYGRRTGNGSV